MRFFIAATVSVGEVMLETVSGEFNSLGMRGVSCRINRMGWYMVKIASSPSLRADSPLSVQLSR